MFEMYPEFIESFNNKLKITYNLRDETQQGIIPVRFNRHRSTRRGAQRLSMIPPPSDEEEGQSNILISSPLFVIRFFALDGHHNLSLINLNDVVTPSSFSPLSVSFYPQV